MKNKQRTLRYIVIAWLITINGCAMMTMIPNHYSAYPELARNHSAQGWDNTVKLAVFH